MMGWYGGGLGPFGWVGIGVSWLIVLGHLEHHGRVGCQ